MARLNYNQRAILIKQIEKEKQIADNIFKERMKLQDAEADYEKIKPIRDKHSNQLIVVETLQSRLNNLGKQTGLEEFSIPKYNN